MTESEVSDELKEWIEKLMRQDLERMAGAGIQSDLMEKKQTRSDASKITIYEEQ